MLADVVSFLLDEPSTTYVCIVLASIAVLLEIAPPPTFGLAGLLAVGLAAVAAVGLGRQGLAWWPLLFTVAGVCAWGAMLAARRAPLPAQVLAAVAFAGGSLGFGLVTDDAPTLVAAVAASLLLPALFPPLLSAAGRLMERPSDVGMDALVGRTAEVTRWSGGEGSVTLDGAFWSAEGPGDIAVDERVTVVRYEGMHLEVQKRDMERDMERRA